jgi:hypothetical protein
MSQTPSNDALSVHDLQALAAEAATGANVTIGKARSRAASLHLIDLLSRWGGSGLAIFAAAAIFIATTLARDHPLRAGLWAAMVFAALYICRRYRKEFRRGDKIASRPFRWRAYYTSTIAVVSAAFGAGAFLLAIPAAPSTTRLEIIAILVVATLAASALHSAYRMTALAAALPASAFIALAALRADGLSLSTVVIIAILSAGAAALFAGSERIGRAADRKFPRTGLVRREIDRGAIALPGHGGTILTEALKAAAKA